MQPPKGWIRIGLNVSRKYDNDNNDWLSTDDKAWPVAYYGLKNSHFIIPKIIKSGIRPGFANMFT